MLQAPNGLAPFDRPRFANPTRRLLRAYGLDPDRVVSGRLMPGDRRRLARLLSDWNGR